MRNRESRNGQSHNVNDHVDDMTRANTFLSHAVRCATISACSLHEKKVTYEVYCLHTPSATVDCYQLHTKPTAANNFEELN